ncbi:MAG: alginate O-acetyltransferase complex protein AlgI [Acidobacteriota bacterium]|jgi:alginate O-acetyltransferase complex protein AlgI|nr:alginate O-acetyltransferase complex protein AlgI [Acidobacteriota bacterium]
MLFTEPLFLFLFLPVLLGVYFTSPRFVRNWVLLGASLFFYASGEKKYVVVLLVSILLNYVAGLLIDRASEMKRRRLILSLGMTGNLLLLGLFKYVGFLVANLNHLAAALNLKPLPVPTLHLPIGISFFIFMGMSYLIDVYWRQIKAERKLNIFSLYITLFPHLIAGPIVRYTDIAKELVSRRNTRLQFAEGIKRFVIGLGKKILIANTLALTVDSIFKVPLGQLTPSVAWLGVISYTLQIYFDFSGYSDMAIGLALMFGFHFPENFNYPYIAESITDFWKRWHITLTTWFRDYLFFPLFRRSVWRTYLNVLIVFFLCGLWHGASWNFVIWGLVHGMFLVVERMGLLSWMSGRKKVFRHLYAMLAIMVGWVFFRAETFSQAFAFLKAMTGIMHGGEIEYNLSLYLNSELLLALIAGILCSMPLIPLLRRWQERFMNGLKGATKIPFELCIQLVNLVALVMIFLASIAFSAAGTYSPFIYFRF